MSAGGSPSPPSPPSAAALRAAAASGDVAACQRLLGNVRGVRFSRDEAGRSALHLAAAAGHAPVVRLLLSVAAPREADGPDADGCAALQRAAADGHEDVARLLLAAGADVDATDAVHGNTATHEAAWKGYSRTTRLLAASGADLAKVNGGGFTALHLCCQNGHNQSCRELLLAGCDPDLQNNYGDTALHTAARYGHAGVTRILISAQARVSERNKNGDTALHIAAAMGRRKLTRILLEAGCDRSVRNKQGESARDIAVRKGLAEIVDILDDCVRRDKKAKGRKRSKSKVRFVAKTAKDKTETPLLEKTKHWSPYGCHYYPDPEAFPSPRLDSLPQEPLKKGEQYYLDLAGNICKGPVSVGYTCYCAPLFRHLEAKIERDKKELMRAQVRLNQRVAGLEQKLSRGGHGRRSERATASREPEPQLPRSRSLEMLDKRDETQLQNARSMDELEAEEQRPSVKELVARIQQQSAANNSESSDDEEALRVPQCKGVMGDSNLVDYENVDAGVPRSRSGLYSPTANVEAGARYVEPIVYVYNQQPSTSKYRYYQNEAASGAARFYDGGVGARLAKLRVLDNNVESKNPIEGSSRMLDATLMIDSVDRDDSGYSTKVYGSSKGNSPSLDATEALGASSLV